MTKGISLNSMLQQRDSEITTLQRKINELEEDMLEMKVLFNRKMVLLERVVRRKRK